MCSMPAVDSPRLVRAVLRLHGVGVGVVRPAGGDDLGVDDLGESGARHALLVAGQVGDELEIRPTPTT
jgi:hypothetical protein